MKWNPVVWIAVASILCAACSRAPDKARHTVEEYLANDALRKEQVARCSNDPGSIDKTPDCINALEAERRDGLGSFSSRFQPTPPGMPQRPKKHPND